MKTQILQTVKIVALALVLSLGVSYVSANTGAPQQGDHSHREESISWKGPVQSPPYGNVFAPINTGTASQIKDGGLGVNTLSVFGDSYFATDVTIGNSGPDVGLRLDVEGAIGAERYCDENGENCYSMTELIALIGAAQVPVVEGSLVYGQHTSVQCADLGGEVQTSGSDQFCKFSASSCPAGWAQFNDWSTTEWITKEVCANKFVWFGCTEFKSITDGGVCSVANMFCGGDYSGGGYTPYCEPSGTKASCNYGKHLFDNVAQESCTLSYSACGMVDIPLNEPMCKTSLASKTCTTEITEIGCY